MPNIVSATQDRLFMRRCFALALRGKGTTAPNPMVGAVIVHEDSITGEARVIGEGYTSPYGGAHAEVNAVAAVAEADRALLGAATLYVSLEPCHHFGKTPPCVDLVLRCGFRRVVICNTDPNPLVAGKSIVRMRAAKIQVHIGLLKKEGWRLNADFFCFFEKKRPRIVLKWAESADGFIGKPNESIWLTSPPAKQRVHEWRSQTMAIMVGANTILADNAALTTRLCSGKSPLRITFFGALPEPKTIQQWAIYANDAPTVVFSTQVKTDDMLAIEHAFFKIICVEKGDDAFILEQILAYLYQKNINSLLVEGGTKLISAFIKADLWDEMRRFTTKKLLQTGIAAPNLGGICISNSYHDIVGDDVLVTMQR